VPITTPTVIEEIAAQYGATVIRTRSDRRATMALAETEGAALDFAGGANHEVIFPEFQPAFDGLYASAKIMELLAAENRTMGELVDMLPSWHIASRRVPCPWERKGEIMRTLFDEQRNENVELIDGIRLFRNGGWVLILPDASDPQFNVYAEGGTDAEARDYVDEFAHRIEDLVSAYVAS
jgi:mannose-1-phosphate guanylyltransferase/phosphomannomutase